MHRFDDVARFLPDDDAPLVAASFACPVCLTLETVGRLVIEADESEVQCSCAACSIAWRVAVDPSQVMRLALHPPTREDAPLRLLPVRTARAPWRA